MTRMTRMGSHLTFFGREEKGETFDFRSSSPAPNFFQEVMEALGLAIREGRTTKADANCTFQGLRGRGQDEIAYVVWQQ